MEDKVVAAGNALYGVMNRLGVVKSKDIQMVLNISKKEAGHLLKGRLDEIGYDRIISHTSRLVFLAYAMRKEKDGQEKGSE